MNKKLLLVTLVLLLSLHAVEGRETYAKNDFLNINLLMQQDNTGDPSSYKHLEYIITNGQGDIVASNQNGPFILLNNYGDYIKKIGDPNAGPGIAVTQDWFVSDAGEAQNKFQQWWSKTPRPTPGTTVIQASSVQLTRNDIPVKEDNLKYILQLSVDGSDVLYKITRGGTFQQGQGYTGGTTICNDKATPSMTITCSDRDLVLTFKLTSLLPKDKDEQYHVFMDLNSKAGYDPCSGQNKIKPQPFTIRFNVYDSDRQGQPLEQLSLDPLTGEEVTTTTTIYATCATAQDPEFAAVAQKAKGEIPEGEILTELRKLFEQLITKETQHKTKLTTDIATDPQPGQSIDRVNTVTQDIQDLSNNEAAAAADLTIILRAIQRSTNPTIKALEPDVDMFINVLQQPLPDLISPPAVSYLIPSIQDTITSAKTNISQTMQGGRDWRVVKEATQTIINDINKLLAEKNNVLDKIKAAQGEAPLTGTITTCPNEQTDAEGNYYFCSTQTPPTPENIQQTRARYRNPTDLKCPTTAETCYKINYINYCGGTKDNKAYSCFPTTACGGPQSGWTRPAARYEGPGQEGYIPFICPTEGQFCCEQPATGTLTQFDKYRTLRSMLTTLQTILQQGQADLDVQKIQTDQYLNDNRQTIQELYSDLAGPIASQKQLIEAKLNQPTTSGGPAVNNEDVEDVNRDLGILLQSMGVTETRLAEYQTAVTTQAVAEIRTTLDATYGRLTSHITIIERALGSIGLALGERALCPTGPSGREVFTCATSAPSGFFPRESYRCEPTTDTCYAAEYPTLRFTTYPGIEKPKHNVDYNLNINSYLPLTLERETGLPKNMQVCFKDLTDGSTFCTFTKGNANVINQKHEFSRSAQGDRAWYSATITNVGSFIDQWGDYEVYLQWPEEEAPLYPPQTKPGTIEIGKFA